MDKIISATDRRNHPQLSFSKLDTAFSERYSFLVSVISVNLVMELSIFAVGSFRSAKMFHSKTAFSCPYLYSVSASTSSTFLFNHQIYKYLNRLDFKIGLFLLILNATTTTQWAEKVQRILNDGCSVTRLDDFESSFQETFFHKWHKYLVTFGIFWNTPLLKKTALATFWATFVKFWLHFR